MICSARCPAGDRGQHQHQHQQHQQHHRRQGHRQVGQAHRRSVRHGKVLNLWHSSIRLPGATMEDATTDCAALNETVVFLSYFRDPKDPRQQGKVTYPLDGVRSMPMRS
jgi:hypothetical protein